jgi:hypothetical protein
MNKQQALALGLTVLTGATLVGSAMAGTKSEELQGRQDIQNTQIEQGVESGDLTKHEANKLIKGQQKINEKAQKATADDKLSRREFHKLEHMQNKESKDIEKKMDNDKEAPSSDSVSQPVAPPLDSH